MLQSLAHPPGSATQQLHVPTSRVEHSQPPQQASERFAHAAGVAAVAAPAAGGLRAAAGMCPSAASNRRFQLPRLFVPPQLAWCLIWRDRHVPLCGPPACRRSSWSPR